MTVLLVRCVICCYLWDSVAQTQEAFQPTASFTGSFTSEVKLIRLQGNSSSPNVPNHSRQLSDATHFSIRKSVGVKKQIFVDLKSVGAAPPHRAAAAP